MIKLSKPIPCSEKWTNMTPTEGGRICKSCSKTIIDFRNKSWKQIQDLQSSNNNSLCGIYKPKQIENWGNEIPAKTELLKKAAMVALITTAISSNTIAQNGNFVTIYGTVLGVSSQVDTVLNTEPIENAQLKIKLFNIQTTTDSLGNYSIKIPKNQIKNQTIELVTITTYYGEKIVEINTSEIENDSINIDQTLHPILIPLEPSISIFYAQPPTIVDTIIEKVDSLKLKK